MVGGCAVTRLSVCLTLTLLLPLLSTCPQISMSFNQEELEQWALAAKQKEDDNLALEKYTRADEAKIRDLSLALEKLTLALAEKRRELEREATETQARQVELDKTAEDFRQLHSERQELVKQWQVRASPCLCLCI
jgi:hypothetical protein